MAKIFKGRVVAPGTAKAKALVSHNGFNTLASYQMALMFSDKQVKCGDQNNNDLYKKPMINKALCLPETSMLSRFFPLLQEADNLPQNLPVASLCHLSAPASVPLHCSQWRW